jgi:hypothetical protein
MPRTSSVPGMIPQLADMVEGGELVAYNADIAPPQESTSDLSSLQVWSIKFQSFILITYYLSNHAYSCYLDSNVVASGCERVCRP